MTAAVVEAPFDLRAQWQRWRLPATLVLLVILVAIALAAVENAPPQRPLDPRDASPVGARALAELLRARGVTVTTTTTVPATAGDATVFVPDPRSLAGAELARLRASTADVVVVAPGSRELDALAVGARPAGVVHERSIDPSCGLAPATTAGSVRFAGLVYRADSAGVTCYPTGVGAGMVVQPSAGHFVVVVGSARMWTNSRLGDDGDAALALGLLSRHPQVSWLLPRPPTRSPADREHKGLFELLPARLLWALLQLAIVVVVVALWRARRLGPVVAEPLPVIVPAAETVRGRARLLRAARARGAAATELRTASVRRMSELLGLGPDAPASAVIAAVADRAGRSGSELESLLYGPEPRDDAALVSLAAALDDVESTVKGQR